MSKLRSYIAPNIRIALDQPGSGFRITLVAPVVFRDRRFDQFERAQADDFKFRATVVADKIISPHRIPGRPYFERAYRTFPHDRPLLTETWRG